MEISRSWMHNSACMFCCLKNKDNKSQFIKVTYWLFGVIVYSRCSLVNIYYIYTFKILLQKLSKCLFSLLREVEERQPETGLREELWAKWITRPRESYGVLGIDVWLYVLVA